MATGARGQDPRRADVGGVGSRHRSTGDRSACRGARRCACGGLIVAGGECAACAARRRGAPPAVRHGDAVVPVSAARVLRGGGRPLDPSTRGRMEAALGHDFRRVRIHTGAAASASAREMAARAWTVGDDVVLSRAAPGPGRPEGDRILAHELSHVAQRRASGSPAPVRMLETSAARAADAVVSRRPAPPLPAAGPVLLRDGPGAPPGASFEASMAEATCDLRTLCRLRFAARDVVSPERVRRVWRSCRPGQRLTTMDPCLMPDPASLAPPARGPSPAPGGPSPLPAAPGPAPAPASGGGLSLPSTTIRFNLGAARFTVDLPASLAVRLPVPFRGAEQVVFSLEASPERFSFSVAINAVPHVRITARAGLTTEGTGSAGLTVETTRRVCRAMDREAARSALQSAGERLRDAIQAVQDPPEPAEDASDFERTTAPHRRLAEVAAAVANVHSTIERVRGRCREVPVATFEFGVRGPVGFPGAEPPTGPSYIGGTATFRF